MDVEVRQFNVYLPDRTVIGVVATARPVASMMLIVFAGSGSVMMVRRPPKTPPRKPIVEIPAAMQAIVIALAWSRPTTRSSEAAGP